MKKGARGTSIVAAALFDALPKGNESNVVSYIESRWPEVKDSREGVEELAEDLTQFGISFILGKKYWYCLVKLQEKLHLGILKEL